MTPTTDCTVTIVLHEKGHPPGTLADAERHNRTGRRDDVKRIGVAVCKHRGATGHHVTFPARPCRVNGARRRVALRQRLVEISAPSGVRDLIVQADAAADATTL